MNPNSLPARRRPLVLSALLISLGCAGCTTTQSGDRVAVQIPRDCEMLAADVPPPELRSGMDARVALARTGAALAEARGNLSATRECQRVQREAFADPK